MELSLAYFGIAFGGQKILLDTLDPSDVALGLLAFLLGWRWLAWNHELRTWKGIFKVVLIVTVYTTLDYLTGISGYPWHLWNQL